VLQLKLLFDGIEMICVISEL